MSLKSVISAGSIAAIATIVTLAAPTSANAVTPAPATDQVSATALLGSGGIAMHHDCGFCGLGD